jgi:acyl-CoA hydrolase
MFEPTSICHLIKPADLNHHGTLFAGTMAAWLIEACFVSVVRLLGRSEDIVCTRVHDMEFREPLRPGDIIDIGARIAHVGGRSITVHASARKGPTGQEAVTILTTFVTLDASGQPCAHGISLPAEYIAAHRHVHDLARRALAGSADAAMPSQDDRPTTPPGSA